MLTSIGMLKVTGGRRLTGRYRVQGSKNSALHLLAAALLVDVPVTLYRTPDVVDVHVYERLMRDAGWAAVYDGDRSIFSVSPASNIRSEVHSELGRLVRTTPVLAAAILARTSRVRFPHPGGDTFCARGIDRHLEAMRAAGATVEVDPSGITAICSAQRLRPFRVDVGTPFGPSRGATMTALLLAARAPGSSLITNPSRDPEVRDAVAFLTERGVLATWDEGGLHISGSDWIAGGEATVAGDRDEAATIICAAAATDGHVHLDGIALPELTNGLSATLTSAGVTLAQTDGGICVDVAGAMRGLEAATGPGALPSNAAPPLASLLTQAQGRSKISERVFPNRDSHVAPLYSFGADISSDGTTVRIRGPRRLRATTASARDVRGAAAVLIAALVAEGTSNLDVLHPLWRGYQHLTEGLAALGADLTVGDSTT